MLDRPVPIVLAQDADFVTAVEKDRSLCARLSTGAPFTLAGRQIFVTGSTQYAGGRMLYQCAALLPGT